MVGKAKPSSNGVGSDQKNILHAVLLKLPQDKIHRFVLKMNTFFFYTNTMCSRFGEPPYDRRWLLVICYWQILCKMSLLNQKQENNLPIGKGIQTIETTFEKNCAFLSAEDLTLSYLNYNISVTEKRIFFSILPHPYY